ncbi:hypothetical protein L1987_33531 [Smallanthus sonchifolius]|uniref:Uncharacterized protein n=1 Tax=Smallanthus sonchifolius TaxID=185202 RepID=A0ACB9HT03_9ASTR|nr:hypothetical protein L1987_33531 [Smallanthus sonchifolius]
MKQDVGTGSHRKEVVIILALFGDMWICRERRYEIGDEAHVPGEDGIGDETNVGSVNGNPGSVGSGNGYEFRNAERSCSNLK